MATIAPGGGVGRHRHNGSAYHIELENVANSRNQDLKTLEIDQISRKYMAAERASEGYIVVFDARTTVGETAVFREHETENKKIKSLVMGIGRPN